MWYTTPSVLKYIRKVSKNWVKKRNESTKGNREL